MQITKRSVRTPLAVGWALRRTREIVDPWLRYRPAGAQGPSTELPPRRLRARSGAPGASAFQEGGRQAAEELAGLLGERRPQAALDFGCGAGRVLPHVAALLPGCACSGCDVDETAIDWARAHRPEQDWSLSSFHPPLPYADESFDLVYSVSVFSHLDRGLAALWLEEIARVLAPEGIALLSVHGAHAFEQFRTGAVRTSWCDPAVFERGPLRSDEFLFVPYARSFWNDGELPGVGRGYGLAFHGAGHIRRDWGAPLQVVELHERALTDWQDVAMCTKC
jgi:SAM-dependent methyltransferase